MAAAMVCQAGWHRRRRTLCFDPVDDRYSDEGGGGDEHCASIQWTTGTQLRAGVVAHAWMRAPESRSANLQRKPVDAGSDEHSAGVVAHAWMRAPESRSANLQRKPVDAGA